MGDAQKVYVGNDTTVNRMNWLVATLLKLSKLDAGVVVFEEKELVLDEICERAINNLEIMAQWRQVRIVKTGESRSILKGCKLDL